MQSDIDGPGSATETLRAGRRSIATLRSARPSIVATTLDAAAPRASSHNGRQPITKSQDGLPDGVGRLARTPQIRTAADEYSTAYAPSILQRRAPARRTAFQVHGESAIQTTTAVRRSQSRFRQRGGVKHLTQHRIKIVFNVYATTYAPWTHCWHVPLGGRRFMVILRFGRWPRCGANGHDFCRTAAWNT